LGWKFVGIKDLPGLTAERHPNMNWLLIVREILTNSIHITLLVAAIIIPLMVGLALLEDSRWLDRAAGFLQPVMQRLKLSNRAAYPLLAGLFLGIIFGSGVIISFARDGSLTKRDLTLVLVFLGICHSIIEDTVVFIALGANGWVLIAARFLLAALAASAVALLFRTKVIAAAIK
jgi:Fe2+ transport system protein B